MLVFSSISDVWFIGSFVLQMTADEPLQKAEFRRPERKGKKPTIDDKDPNVSDDEDGYGRGRGRWVMGRNVCAEPGAGRNGQRVFIIYPPW